MKKSSKRIPKSHLPKYFPGGRTDDIRPSVDNSMYGSPESEGSMMGATQDMGEGTQNIYNENRAKSSMLGTNQKLTGNQYAQMGQAVAQGGMQAYQTSQTPGLSEYEKNQQYGESIKSAEQGVVSAINPIFGMIHSGVTAATAPLTAKATQTDEQGNLKNKNFAKADIIGQGFADPMAMIPTMISNKFSMKKYINSVEDNAKGKIAAQKAQEDAYAQQQAAYQQQQNDYINNAIQAGMAKYQNQPQGSYIQYSNGGMNMQPNAEIEKQENVVDPNGSFLQVDGSTHENGGVPVALPGNSMIFSDRLKLGKKTFAELNKVNNTNKEDKILESNKFGNTSKRTAELMKFAKNKNSEELFNAQEALKQAKVEAYAKKMGYELPQTSQVPQQEFAMGGVQLPYYNIPKFPNGGEYVNGVWVDYEDEDTQLTRGFQQDSQLTLGGAPNNVGENSKINNLITNEDFNRFKENSSWVTEHHISNISNSDLNYNDARGYAKDSNDSRRVVASQMSGWPEDLPDNNNPRNNPNLNQPNAYLIRKDKNGKLIFDNPNPYKAQKPFDFAAADARQQAEIDAVDNRKVTDPNDKNFDWGSLAQTGQSLGNFALQNAGNIYDLTRKQDPLQKYARAKASFLDPSAAIRNAMEHTRRAEYNIRNASGGNAGTYLANRVGLNAQNISMVDAIRQQYANANAGIANQNSQFNTEIAYREAEAQAKDRAMRQNVNSQAIHSMASNFGKASKASKENSMDQKELDLFMYRYKNEPGFKEQVDKFRTA